MTGPARFHAAVVTLPSAREIRIERTFLAPVDLVFDAWTRPELVRRWWGDPAAPLAVCEIDLRVGGEWRYATGDGPEAQRWYGTFLEIVRPRLVRSTEAHGNDPRDDAQNTITFDPTVDGTRCVITVLHPTRAHRDRHLATGMEQGLQLAFQRIDGVLAEHAGTDTDTDTSEEETT